MFVLANVLQPLIDFFEAFLKFFHDEIGMGWGLSIVALTVVIRAALLPLTFKQFRSMQRLATFQPEIKRLQDKYKNDRDRLNQEMMKFYRENKVNPLASCLPLLAQLPVFLALFYMLQADLRRDICPERQVGQTDPIPCGAGADAGFLFIPDLTDRATGSVLIALIVLYVGSQLLSTLLMSTTTDRNQRLIFLALPFLFIAFIWNFPAGLLLYWITTNLWTIVQQAIVRRRLGPIRPMPDDGGGGLGSLFGGRSPTPTPSGGTAPAAVAAGSSPSAAATRSGGPPPAPPRKKKKRSGRRR